MKILNLYAGLGGNRKLWEKVQVTAIEHHKKIAEEYQRQNPNDIVLVEDAHKYLLGHYSEFDAVWSSPPCPTHSRFTRSGKNRKACYPDLKLYEEILFLKHNFEGMWIVENVIPYYEPLIRAKKIGRHLFWSNFHISDFREPKPPMDFINDDSPQAVNALKKWLGINYSGNIYATSHSPGQVLRNCVHPATGLHILKCMLTYSETQLKLAI